MARHDHLRVDTGPRVYCCAPHGPWQRGTNGNTDGLLRPYFPKGTDLGLPTAADPSAVAGVLNARRRKALGWRTPAGAPDQVLRSAHTDPVATTA